MLYNKERPNRFDDMVGQTEVVTNIRNQSRQDKFFHIYILGGQFGSGKTTMARIISLAANCTHKDENGNPCLECENCKKILSEQTTEVIEMDGASNTGVDSIRELKETVLYLPSDLRKKIYIIDEVHMLSKGAFNSLLKVLEEPPEYTIFILCTTDVNAIPATVRSRAANYYFEQIKYDDIISHLIKVSVKHNLEVEKDALSLIAKNSHGAMRNALSLLEQAAETDKVVTAETISRMLGISDPKLIFELLGYLISSDTSNCIKTIENIVSMGKDLFLLVSDMLDICADGVVASCSGVDTIYNTEQYKEQLMLLVNNAGREQFCSIAMSLICIRDELRKMPSKTTLIIGIIRMTSDSTVVSENLSRRISELEEKIRNIGTVVAKDANAYMHVSEVEVPSVTVEDKFEDISQEEKNIDEEVLIVEKVVQEQVGVEETDIIFSTEDTKQNTVSENIVITDSESESLDEDNLDFYEMLDIFEMQSVVSSVKAVTKDTTAAMMKNQEKQSEVTNNATSEPADHTSIYDMAAEPVHSEKESEESYDDIMASSYNFDSEILPEDEVNELMKEMYSDLEANKNETPSELDSELKKILENAQARLNSIYSDEPVLENAIEFGCKKTVTKDGVVLETSIEPIYRIISKYIEVMDLPVEVQLAA